MDRQRPGLVSAGDETAEVRNDVGQLRERMAHLEGLPQGLREAIADNRGA